MLFMASATVLACYAQKLKTVSEAKMTETPKGIVGQLSQNSENDNGEKDPPFILKFHPFETDNPLPGKNQGFMSDLAKPMDIALNAAHLFARNGMSIELLAQHKYMQNECLGIKVNIGELSLPSVQPEVRINNSGMYIRYAFGQIVVDKMNIRSTPCGRDGECHFGAPFAINGTVADVVLEVMANPVMDLQNCTLVDVGKPAFNWKIGAISLDPLTTDQRKLARSMILDALNTQSDIILPIRLKEALGNALRESSPCAGTKTAAIGIAHAITMEDAQPWVQTDGASRAASARLTGTVPSGTRFETAVYAGDQLVLSTQIYPIVLSPGTYRVKINNIPVEDVPLQKGKNTKLRVGYISFSSADWSIYDESGMNLYLSGVEKGKVAVPVGKYTIRTGNKRQPQKVDDDMTIHL